MAWFGIPAWWRSRRRRAKDPYSWARRGELDIVKAPPYQLPLEEQQRRRAEVEALIAGLNGGLDANWASREVLYNLINAWMLQWIAMVNAQRDERQAVLDILVGLAAEELARREARYEADLSRAEQARMALEDAFERLTGRKASDFVAPELRRVGERRGRARRDAGETATTGPGAPPEAARPTPTAPGDRLVGGSPRISLPATDPSPNAGPSPNGRAMDGPEPVPRQTQPPAEELGLSPTSTDLEADQ